MPGTTLKMKTMILKILLLNMLPMSDNSCCAILYPSLILATLALSINILLSPSFQIRAILTPCHACVCDC